MPAPENLIKSRMLAGDLQIGCWLGSGSTGGAEIAGAAGFDWCLIDAEHGVHDLPSIRDQLNALAAVGCPSAIRVADNEPWMLKQALDLGAQTVLVPMVNSADEAKAAVRSVRYPPAGNRGLAAAVVRASGYGAQPDYAVTADDQICLMVQVETRESVDNIDEILSVDGVDCILIGPFDLAADMGFLADPNAPQVMDAIAHIMARTAAAGKGVGIFCLRPEDLPKYRGMGANFIAVASDVVSLRTALTSRAAEARALCSDQ